MDTAAFLEKGYVILPANNMAVLIDMRNKIFEHAKKMVNYRHEPVEEFFDKFHHYKLTGSELNEKRVALFNALAQQLDIGQMIYEAYSHVLLELLGPDLVVQKGANVVIQQPGDPNFSPTHRDAPPHSYFEIVVWLPLTDIYETKGMYVLNKEQSAQAVSLLAKGEEGYEQFKAFGAKEGMRLKMSFGEALFFWPGLVHGITVNNEEETRWSLNIRYKNIFSPVGPKGLSEYFKILRLSPLATVGFEAAKKDLV